MRVHTYASTVRYSPSEATTSLRGPRSRHSPAQHHRRPAQVHHHLAGLARDGTAEPARAPQNPKPCTFLKHQENTNSIKNRLCTDKERKTKRATHLTQPTKRRTRIRKLPWYSSFFLSINRAAGNNTGIRNETTTAGTPIQHRRASATSMETRDAAYPLTKIH